jgi:predicted metal-dependent hydrolase
MNTEPHVITVSGIRVQIVRKEIKNLHLGVYPPGGRVRVAAPLAVTDDGVRLAVVGKLGWIRRQRTKFQTQLRQSEREMVSGESHYFLGRRYRLRVVSHDGPGKVHLRNNSIVELHVSQSSDASERERILQRWYRERLKELIPPLLEKWQKALKVEVAQCRVKKMKTKWGSCNAAAGRIWLNLELAKKPVQCLEYLVVHELAHLIERRHNENFISIMNKYLPKWRLHREELNSAPLANETWSY